MAKYTIELNTLLKDSKFNLFDFEYDFYDNNLKGQFEEKFKDYYRFNEIGFETVKRFKHYLKTKLNTIMPYYTQLYETQLEAKNINFLLNKDLKETFIREVEGGDTSSSVSYSNTTNSTSSTTDAISDSTSKESYLDNGNADLSLTDGLTGVSSNNSTGNSTSSSTGEDTNNTTNDTTSTNNMKEKTELLSQGNIGITSSAELLQKWRDTIIDINRMILEECSDLFMQIY